MERVKPRTYLQGQTSLFDNEPIADANTLAEERRFGMADGQCVFGLSNRYSKTLKGSRLEAYISGYKAGTDLLRRELRGDHGDTAPTVQEDGPDTSAPARQLDGDKATSTAT